jgi:putative flippase GtrA
VGERWQKFAAEVGRFLAIGLLATIVALILFNLLVHGFNTGEFAPLNDQPELAYAIANAVGMLISFRGTRDWAFRDRQARHADGGVLAFVVINLVTMTIPIACLWISRSGLGLDDPLSDNVSANVIGLLLANAARFFLFRTYVFQRKPLPFHLHLTHAEVEEELTGLADRSTDRSTSDPVPPAAP